MTETALEKLADYLLPKTLEHAVNNSAFYARHLPDEWRTVEGAADLGRLPLLDKATCVEHQEALRCGQAAADFGSVSSGTTRVGKKLFRVERCPEELDALHELHGLLDEIGGGSRPGAPEEAPLVMHVLTPNHGLPAGAAPANTIRFAWSPSRNVCQLILQALQSDYGGRRISVLRCSVSVLKQLTVWLTDAGVDVSALGVTFIGTNAALVTRRWREIFERAWGARVFDNYSLSEIKTPATECDSCGWYHFGEPPVVVELVDPVSGQVLAGPAVGELVMTALYPYVQRTPLIRYRTGDLLERGPRCPAQRAESFRFKGRVHQTLSAGGRHLVFSSSLEDIADAHAGIARHVHPFERAEKIPPQRVGQPKYRAALVGDDVELTFGTAYDPALFVADADALRARLEAEVLSAHPVLAEDVAGGVRRLRVSLVPGLRDDDWGEWFVKYLA